MATTTTCTKDVVTQYTQMLLPLRSQQDVKLQFLSTLGGDEDGKIEPTPASNSSCNDIPITQPLVPYSVDGIACVQRNATTYTLQESLKYDVQEDRLYASKSPRTVYENSDSKHKDQPPPPTQQQQQRRRTTSTSPPKSLSFHEMVEVVPIPMRTEYSNRVKARLWSNTMEIKENAARNTLEFASEGWNWRNVLEEDSMYECVVTEELVHPSHYYYPMLKEGHGFRI